MPRLYCPGRFRPEFKVVSRHWVPGTPGPLAVAPLDRNHNLNVPGRRERAPRGKPQISKKKIHGLEPQVEDIGLFEQSRITILEKNPVHPV